MRFLFFIFVLVVASQAHAYPENVRHGYVNCTACHASPTGGGALTAYGRSLSAELMSTWSYKGEEGFLHGAIREEKMPEWLMIGGDIRELQTYKDNPQFTETKYVPMQEDFEAAVRYKNVTLDLEFGHIYEGKSERLGSRRYYAMYNITDEWTVRAGRFFPQFGLNISDHYVPTRSRTTLGFDEGMERNNIEAGWNGENWSAFLTASQSPGETPLSSRETGYAAQLNKNIGDSSKIGASGWFGRTDGLEREILGVHGILGFSKKLFLLSEFDHQWSSPRTAVVSTRGFFAYNRLGYELTKGLILFGHAEYSQTDLDSGATSADAYGPGLQFFPRPHFEFVGLWRKVRTRSTSADFTDYAYLLMHYYF